MLSCPRFTNLPTSKGIEPVNWFSDRSRYNDKDERPTSSFGIGQLKLFWERDKDNRFCQFPRLLGMAPRKTFCLNSTSSDQIAFPREDGILPEILFPLRSRSAKLCSLPIELGIMPSNRFDSKTKAYRFMRLPISVGMDPRIWFPPNPIPLHLIEKLLIVSLLTLASKSLKLVLFAREERKLRSSSHHFQDYCNKCTAAVD